ncbi:hypothetical protein MNBD_GAMMA13-1281 [hydrothermal vent metagenome]|uniref:Two-component transcriptional response regulator, LuxR family n=1 Tax=hydrothermal vent metagenome TaxID=652676 RepID=A0A3B0YYY2_9ZZZZ
MLILLADDHELMREGVKLVLNKHGSDFRFLEAQDYAQTLCHIETNPLIDVILLDLAMPGKERLQGLKQVRLSAPSIPIIVLSVFENSSDVKAALMLGANGYVPKSSASTTLPYAIDRVLQGETYTPSSMLTQPEITTGTQYFAYKNSELQLMDKEITGRQREVLQYLVEGYSNKEIARKLNITESTIKTHLTNIYRILGISSRTGAVRAALNLGMQ